MYFKVLSAERELESLSKA